MSESKQRINNNIISSNWTARALAAAVALALALVVAAGIGYGGYMLREIVYAVNKTRNESFGNYPKKNNRQTSNEMRFFLPIVSRNTEWIKCETKITKIFVQKHKQHKHRRHASLAVVVAAASVEKKNQMQHKHGVDCQIEHRLHPVEMYGACTFSHSFSYLKTEQRK